MKVPVAILKIIDAKFLIDGEISFETFKESFSENDKYLENSMAGLHYQNSLTECFLLCKFLLLNIYKYSKIFTTSLSTGNFLTSIGNLTSKFIDQNVNSTKEKKKLNRCNAALITILSALRFGLSPFLIERLEATSGNYNGHYYKLILTICNLNLNNTEIMENSIELQLRVLVDHINTKFLRTIIYPELRERSIKYAILQLYSLDNSTKVSIKFCGKLEGLEMHW